MGTSHTWDPTMTALLVKCQSDERQRNDYVVGQTREQQRKVVSLAAVGVRWNILGRCEPLRVVVSRYKLS